MAYYITKFGYVNVQSFIALLKVIFYFFQFCKNLIIQIFNLIAFILFTSWEISLNAVRI